MDRPGVEMSCGCQGCSRRYELDLVIPDDLWAAIRPEGKSEGAGLLCAPCIVKKLEDLFGYAVFELKEVE